MKALISSYNCDKEAPHFKITDHGWFLSFVIKSKDPQFYPNITFYLDDLQTLVNLKNNFLSAYNKAIREAGYDR